VMLAGVLLCLPAIWLVSFPLFLAGIFGIALGIATLQTTANPCISLLGPAETAASRLLLVQSFIPIGSVISPLAGYLLFGRWNRTLLRAPLLFPRPVLLSFYASVAIMLLIVACLLHRHFAENGTFTQEPHTAPQWNEILTRPMLYGIVSVFFFVGAEATVLGHSIPYLSIASVRGFLPATAATLLSAYWMFVIAGRLGAARMLRTFETRMVLQIACFSAVLLTLAAIAFSAPMGGFCLLALGLCNAAVFPCLFTLSVDRLALHELPYASAILSTAICGGGVIPLLCGLIADHAGVRVALALPCCIYGCIGSLAFWCYPSDGHPTG